MSPTSCWTRQGEPEGKWKTPWQDQLICEAFCGACAALKGSLRQGIASPDSYTCAQGQAVSVWQSLPCSFKTLSC